MRLQASLLGGEWVTQRVFGPADLAAVQSAVDALLTAPADPGDLRSAWRIVSEDHRVLLLRSAGSGWHAPAAPYWPGPPAPREALRARPMRADVWPA